MRRTEVLVDDLDHPEGVAWDPASGVLWAGGEAGQLYRVDLDAKTWSEAARAPGFVLGLAVDGRGRLALCCGEAVCVYDGAVTNLRDGFTQPNYAAFASDGTLYFSDSGHWARDNGRVYRLAPDGALDVFSDRVPHFPNGCAVSPDGQFLWLVESYRPTLSRFDLATGELEEVTRLPGTVPDGVALEWMQLEDLGNGRTRLIATSLTDSFEGRDAFVASGMETGVREGYERLDELLAR